MKRLFALILAVLLVLSFTACSTAPASTTGATDDTTASIETTVDPYAEITFNELSVYEGEDFSVVITGIDPENPSGYALNVTLTNNTDLTEESWIEYIYETNEEGKQEIVDEIEHVETSGSSLRFTLESISANGTAIDAAFSTDVEADYKTYNQILLSQDAIASLGVITEIELSISVSESGKEEAITTVTAIVHPYGVSEETVETTEG